MKFEIAKVFVSVSLLATISCTSSTNRQRYLEKKHDNEEEDTDKAPPERTGDISIGII